MPYYWFDGGHMIWMTLSWLIIAGLFVLLLSYFVGGSRPPQSNESPEAILKRRYAAGEIDTEEFDASALNIAEGERRGVGHAMSLSTHGA